MGTSFKAITIMLVTIRVERKKVELVFFIRTLYLLYIIRNDLSFDECIMAKLRFGRKKILLYRNPKYKTDSPEFLTFTRNLGDLHTNILNERSNLLIFTGDFNAHSVQWWPNGDSNNEGTQLNISFCELELTQLITEPTHLRDHCQPTSIDLILCDQPNLVIDSGVNSSLDQTCKHQITYCKFSIKSPQIPPIKRKVCHYGKGNRDLINRAITNFQWDLQLNKIPNPNHQVDF